MAEEWRALIVKAAKARNQVKNASAKDLATKTSEYRALLKAAMLKKRKVSLIWATVKANQRALGKTKIEMRSMKGGLQENKTKGNKIPV